MAETLRDKFEAATKDTRMSLQEQINDNKEAMKEMSKQYNNFQTMLEKQEKTGEEQKQALENLIARHHPNWTKFWQHWQAVDDITVTTKK